MAVLVLPRFSTVDRIKASVRKLNVVSKQVQNQARLTNTLHRIVIELTPQAEAKTEDKNSFEQGFYVEVANSKSARVVADSASEEKPDEDEENPTTDFAPDTKLLKRKEVLPNNFFFKDVEFKDKIIENGKAYIYFFPQGYVTQAAIHITNKDKINYTIIIHPLTGQTTIFNEEKRLKDLQP